MTQPPNQRKKYLPDKLKAYVQYRFMTEAEVKPNGRDFLVCLECGAVIGLNQVLHNEWHRKLAAAFQGK